MIELFLYMVSGVSDNENKNIYQSYQLKYDLLTHCCLMSGKSFKYFMKLNENEDMVDLEDFNIKDEG